MTKNLIYESNKIADVYIADTFLKRFLGYMFRKKPHYDAILLKPCNSIHTFFMRFEIDVIFVNEDLEIVKKIEGLKPGRIITAVKGATMMLEARSGLFYDCKLGEQIVIW